MSGGGGGDIDMLSCANCGKGEEDSNKLKKCSACLSVKYCSAECQKAHRQQHKKACKKRAAELFDEKLFADPPPREECPICFQPFPIGNHQTFESCCGKLICNGCIYAMQMSEGKDLCAFCRTPPCKSDEDIIRRIKKLIDNGNAQAFFEFANYHANGLHGMPQNYQKANELYLKAGELGCTLGYYNLGNNYRDGKGVEVGMKKAKNYLEIAAIGGSIVARNNLGALEGKLGNHHRAMKHFVMAAKVGHKTSLNNVKTGFMKGIVTKDDYANTLRAYHERQRETKSEMRDKAEAHWGQGPVSRGLFSS